MPETLWRSDNYPVAIKVGASYHRVPRAQSFSVQGQRDVQQVYELGTAGVLGSTVGPEDATGTLNWYPINVLVENLLCGVNSTTQQVTLLNMQNAAGADVTGPTGARGLLAAKVTSLEYTINVPDGIWEATARLSGTAVDWDGAAVSGASPSGAVAFRSPQAMLRFSGYTANFLRIKQASIRLNVTPDKAYQLSDPNAFDVALMQPVVSGEITWHSVYESGTQGAHSWRPLPEPGSELDIIIQVGTGAWDAPGNVEYKLFNVIWSQREETVRTRARGEMTISYSGGDATTSGFSCRVIPSP